MSDVLEQVGVESIEHLDFEPPCYFQQCEAEVEFHLHCKTCPMEFLLCRPHLEEMKLRALNASRTACASCVTWCTDFVDVYVVRPIR